MSRTVRPDTIPAPSTARLNRIRRRSHHKTTSKAGLMNRPYNGILRLHAGEGACHGGGVPSSTPPTCRVTARLPGGDHVANRRNTAARSIREATEDGRQLSLIVRERDAEPPNEPPKLALHIPPPRSPVSAVRRLELAARWATDLGEL